MARRCAVWVLGEPQSSSASIPAGVRAARSNPDKPFDPGPEPCD
jgi:hypothetical protein